MADNNETKNVNANEINHANQNANVGDAPQNNSEDNEYLGLQELFGEISLDNPKLTSEQQEYIMENIRQKARAGEVKEREPIDLQAMIKNWSLQQKQGGALGNNKQPASRSIMNEQGASVGFKIPGMNYVPVAKPQAKVEEKKPTVPQQPKKTYVSENIPGMGNVANMRVLDTANRPQLTQEEFDAKTLKNAEESLAQLQKMPRTSDPDERRARAAQEKQLRKIIDDIKRAKEIEEEIKAAREAEQAKKDNAATNHAIQEEQAPAKNDVAEPKAEELKAEEPKVEEPQVDAPVEQNNRQRELTEEEKARRAADDERLAQMMQNFQREMAEIDAEEEREARENQEEAEPEQERPARSLDYLFEEDDEEELDPFAQPNTIQLPKIPQMPQAPAEPQVEAVGEQQNEINANNPQRELTEEEKARRAADDERLAQMMQNFQREMADIDAEEEREARANEEKVAPEEKRPARPLDYLFEEDDEEELDPFLDPKSIPLPQMPQMPQINIEPQVKEVNVPENNIPQRELTEEEKARRAADDERLAQMMQNFRKEMAEIDAEEEAAFDILGGAAEMVAALEAEPKEIDNSVNATVFVNTLNTFNAMYKLSIDANNFAFFVNEAWTLLNRNNEQKKIEGQKMLGDLFKNTLKQAFDVEKGIAYDEHRLPEYAEIIKSSNELLRTAMFAFTDLYHNPKSASLFDSTAFGGLNAKEMADLTVGDSLWSMDQKSDEAWDIQSKEAKNLADKWLAGDKPYEKMISEMKSLVEADKNSSVDRKEMLTKLTAAEWLLVNNDKMMIDDPEDPLNKLPNWGNRYWKALTEAREALGIDKHTSMRDLIQGDYAASAKAVISSAYNEAQIEDYVLDPTVREIYDSMETQKEQFATQSAAVTLTEPQNEKNAGEVEMTEDRVPFPIQELDERVIMKNQPKNYNFVIERTAEFTLGGPNQGR